jgi:hypothetical protein
VKEVGMVVMWFISHEEDEGGVLMWHLLC